ncbi:prepilin-type N-terminal cleavage/methylation domain-containing protein [Aliivibrio logei]|uniref:MSHA biogenesis protein MshA n=1 Tax=Aliivibrio logei 5S-186 TaxID=626086 RepID=A0ABX3B2Z1_ALILO|nr:prepilin-type N-terminal cleavage/methylation domain-containing protein [Aliivibrio logei]OEF22901.1 MSHA biogenesis protein MshA [Aliivibrio logei 5S-186]
MKRQGGFTLIELVVVIVILGILAVTAAPKFLNLQGDARASSLQGLKGAMAGASGIVYGKAAINGVETSAVNPTDVDGIDTVFGYPIATASGIEEAVVGLSDDWSSFSQVVSAPANSITYSFVGSTAPANFSTGCFVNYAQASTVSSGVSITVVDNDC